MSGADREWIYAVGDQRKGPMTASDLALLVSGDQLPNTTLVWKAGMSEWVPAKDVPEIASLCAPRLPRNVAASPKPTGPSAASPMAAAAAERKPTGTVRAASEEQPWRGGWISSPVVRWSVLWFVVFIGVALRGMGDPTWIAIGWGLNAAAVAMVVGIWRQTRWWMVPAGILGGWLGLGITASVFSLITRPLPDSSGAPAASAPSQRALTSVTGDQPSETGPAAGPTAAELSDGDAAAIADLAVLSVRWRRWIEIDEANGEEVLLTGRPPNPPPGWDIYTSRKDMMAASRLMSALPERIENASVRTAVEALTGNYSTWIRAEVMAMKTAEERMRERTARGQNPFFSMDRRVDPDRDTVEVCKKRHSQLTAALLTSLGPDATSPVLSAHLERKGILGGLSAALHGDPR